MGGVRQRQQETVLGIESFRTCPSVAEKFAAARDEPATEYSFLVPLAEKYCLTQERGKRFVVFHHTELLLRFLRAAPAQQITFIEQIFQEMHNRRTGSIDVQIAWGGHKKPRTIRAYDHFRELHFSLLK